jgi:hypothetical protein
MQEIDSLKDDDKNHLFANLDAFLSNAINRKAYAA